jgi:hypothetical protein
MRNAVILTGALRTIRKAIRFLKENVLQNQTDVFICVQNDTAESEDTWKAWFTSHLGDRMLSLQWFHPDRFPGWVQQREVQLEHMTVENHWKQYLRTSGSMIEYYQLQLAYMMMSYHEQIHHILYDYVIRARTDSIYCKPLDFHWLHWTDEELGQRLDRIRADMLSCNKPITDQSVLMYLMTTLLSDDLLPNLPWIRAECVPCPTESFPPHTDSTALNRYLREGRYILTLRKNNLYLLRRSLFHMIPTLGSMYGFLRSPHSDNYWFNAEGQFRDACYYACLTVFDYSTLFEERSLEYAGAWKEEDFFDLEGNVLHPAMLYCVVRR